MYGFEKIKEILDEVFINNNKYYLINNFNLEQRISIFQEMENFTSEQLDELASYVEKLQTQINLKNQSYMYEFYSSFFTEEEAFTIYNSYTTNEHYSIREIAKLLLNDEEKFKIVESNDYYDSEDIEFYKSIKDETKKKECIAKYELDEYIKDMKVDELVELLKKYHRADLLEKIIKAIAVKDETKLYNLLKMPDVNSTVFNLILDNFDNYELIYNDLISGTFTNAEAIILSTYFSKFSDEQKYNIIMNEKYKNIIIENNESSIHNIFDNKEYAIKLLENIDIKEDCLRANLLKMNFDEKLYKSVCDLIVNKVKDKKDFFLYYDNFTDDFKIYFINNYEMDSKLFIDILQSFESFENVNMISLDKIKENEINELLRDISLANIFNDEYKSIIIQRYLKKYSNDIDNIEKIIKYITMYNILKDKDVYKQLLNNKELSANSIKLILQKMDPNFLKEFFKQNEDYNMQYKTEIIKEKLNLSDKLEIINNYKEYFMDISGILIVLQDNELKHDNKLQIQDNVIEDITDFILSGLSSFEANYIPDFLYNNIIFVKKFIQYNNPLILRYPLNISLCNEDEIETIAQLMNRNEYYTYFDKVYTSSPIVFEHFINNGFINGIDFFEESMFNEKNLNFMFLKYNTSDILKCQIIKKDLTKLYNKIQIDDYSKVFNDLLNSEDYIKIAVVLSKYNKDRINDNNLETLYNILFEKLIDKYKNDEVISSILEQTIKNGKNPYCLNFIKTKKQAYAQENLIDVLSEIENLHINNIYGDVLNKINKKHFRTIVSFLQSYNIEQEKLFNIAINMYLVLGNSRCIDFLNPNENKNYGKIDREILIKLFDRININDISLIEEGKGYAPQINESLINLIFGNNYKIKNTPIRNYLNNFAEKKEEINKKLAIAMEDPELSEEDKNIVIDKLKKEFDEYKLEVLNFFENNFQQVFYKWDIIQEEFLKKQSKSKLKLKLNIEQINQICKALKGIENSPVLEERDELLKESSVFEYVGIDTQFTTNIDKVRERTIDLSRGMDNVKKKKIPDVTLEKKGYYLKTYNPQDRNILSAGIRSGCCFRPNGNADNHGNNNSLLYYCTNTEYGGGIEIVDSNGKTIMFSPVLRNGNVLMIHSIETKGLTDVESSIVHEILKEYAETVINLASHNNDDISFVTITDLHHLNSSFARVMLPNDKKFKIFDDEQKFNEMYTNLENNHCVLAHGYQKTFDDIKYGEVLTDYYYPQITSQNKYVSIMPVDIDIITEMSEIKNQISILSNSVKDLKNDDTDNKSNTMLYEAKELRKQYLSFYKQLLKKYNNIDVYMLYVNGIKVMNKLMNESGEYINCKPSSIYYKSDWFIAIDGNNVYAYSKDPDDKEYSSILTELMSLNPNLIMNGESLDETRKNVGKN